MNICKTLNEIFPVHVSRLGIDFFHGFVIIFLHVHFGELKNFEFNQSNTGILNNVKVNYYYLQTFLILDESVFTNQNILDIHSVR